jgi:hypothetical protein
VDSENAKTIQTLIGEYEQARERFNVLREANARHETPIDDHDYDMAKLYLDSIVMNLLRVLDYHNRLLERVEMIYENLAEQGRER